MITKAMGLLAKLKGVVGGTPEETETYECQACSATYETPVSLCEACGGDQVTRVE